MNLLLTGANGFIGRHVARALAEYAPRLRVVQTDRQRESQTGAAEYCPLDLVEPNAGALDVMLRDAAITAVVNCAGTTDSAPAALATANVVATSLLLRAAARLGSEITFCHIGSAAEYRMLPRPMRTSEECATQPAGVYGHSKLAASTEVLAEAARSGMRSYVLRLFNPVGVGMPPTQLVGRLLWYLRSGPEEPLRVGSLASFRDYVDVADVGRAVVASLQYADVLPGQAVNIGSGEAHCTRAVVEGILEATGRGSVVEDAEAGSDRSKWADWQEAEISKAERLLGWRPQVSFEDSIRDLASSVILTGSN